MRFLRTRRAAFIAMLIAGAACVIMQYVFAHNKPWVREEPYDIASNILAGKGYSYQFDWGALQKTCYIPPGYVAILLALWNIGFSDMGIQFINAIIYMLSAVIAYRIARKLGQSRDVSFLAFLAVAFYPPLWILAFVPSPNAINIFLVLLSVEQLLVARKNPSLKNFLILGILFVVQLYIRPDVLVWAPLSVLWLWYVTKDKIAAPNFVKYTLAAVVLSVVFVSPWTIRNYVVFHRFVLISANGGSNLWIGNNPAADGEFPPTVPGKPLIQDSIISRL
ncbi:MAG TPA: glycosyltransferase family 39 protein, partial [Candidatus Kapabacteria bacterium]|nr:glycosyltransferase family 39 protein [Candidatus Kapabacteria bacterium]